MKSDYLICALAIAAMSACLGITRVQAAGLLTASCGHAGCVEGQCAYGGSQLGGDLGGGHYVGDGHDHSDGFFSVLAPEGFQPALQSGASSPATVTTQESSLDSIYSQSSFGDSPIDIRFLDTVELVAPSLQVLDTGSEVDSLFDLAPSGSFRTINLFFVDEVNACGMSENNGIVGCGQTPGRNSVVESGFAAGRSGAELIAHELGHNLGLQHVADGSSPNLLTATLNGNTSLTTSQAESVLNNFRVQSDSAGRFVEIQPILVIAEEIPDEPSPPPPFASFFGVDFGNGVEGVQENFVEVGNSFGQIGANPLGLGTSVTLSSNVSTSIINRSPADAVSSLGSGAIAEGDSVNALQDDFLFVNNDANAYLDIEIAGLPVGTEAVFEGFFADTREGLGAGGSVEQQLLLDTGSGFELIDDQIDASGESGTPTRVAFTVEGTDPVVFRVQGNNSFEQLRINGFAIGLDSALEAALVGDFNSDRVVSAADFVVFRDTLPIGVSFDDFTANFGADSTASASLASAVPEPSTLLLTLLATSAIFARRR